MVHCLQACVCVILPHMGKEGMCVHVSRSASPLPPVIQHRSGDGCFLHEHFPFPRMLMNNANANLTPDLLVESRQVKSRQVTQDLVLVPLKFDWHFLTNEFQWPYRPLRSWSLCTIPIGCSPHDYIFSFYATMAA